MTTALSIINRAAEVIGYKDPSEALSGDDADNFLGVLNDLVDSWRSTNVYLWATIDHVQTVSGNPVTIGPSATLNIERPTFIPDGGFFRIGNIDYAFDMVQREQYASLPYKSINTPWPRYCYYDLGLPTGNLYFYPALSGSAELHLPIQQQIESFADLSTDYTLPPGAARALQYSLAEELAAGGIGILTPKLERLASSARDVIKTFEIPVLTTDLPSRLSGSILDGWNR